MTCSDFLNASSFAVVSDFCLHVDVLACVGKGDLYSAVERRFHRLDFARFVLMRGEKCLAHFL